MSMMKWIEPALLFITEIFCKPSFESSTMPLLAHAWERGMLSDEVSVLVRCLAITRKAPSASVLTPVSLTEIAAASAGTRYMPPNENTRRCPATIASHTAVPPVDLRVSSIRHGVSGLEGRACIGILVSEGVSCGCSLVAGVHDDDANDTR
jgi:hypothetical protein